MYKTQVMDWNDIEDKTPEDGQQVIVACKVTTDDGQISGWYKFESLYSDGMFFSVEPDKNVTCWMAFPEDPQ